MSVTRPPLWQRLRAHFAFLPAVALAAGVASGFVMLAIDARVPGTAYPDVLRSLGTDSARAMLTAIATSSLTIGALAVSLTLAVLTHAGAQFSPRVLKTFLRDPVSQASVGLLLAVHAYCLVVLGGLIEEGPVPVLACLVAALAAFVSVALLIHHVSRLAQSLRSSQVVAAIALETAEGIDALGPPREAPVGPKRDEPVMTVFATRSGYLQAADLSTLESIARETETTISVAVPFGTFLAKGEALARCWPARPSTVEARRIRDCLKIGAHLECDQDPDCGMRQLVDLGLRALSPGINDPHSACLAIDRLGDLLSRLARSEARPATSASNASRCWMPRRAVAERLALCLDPLRQQAAGHTSVIHRLTLALARVARAAPEDEVLSAAIARQRRQLVRVVSRDVSDSDDQDVLLRELEPALGGPVQAR